MNSFEIPSCPFFGTKPRKNIELIGSDSATYQYTAQKTVISDHVLDFDSASDHPCQGAELSDKFDTISTPRGPAGEFSQETLDHISNMYKNAGSDFFEECFRCGCTVNYIFNRKKE